MCWLCAFCFTGVFKGNACWCYGLGGGEARGEWSVMVLGTTLKIEIGGTERVEKVHSQLTWSSGGYGLWLSREWLSELGAGMQLQGGEGRSGGMVCGIHRGCGQQGGCSVAVLGVTLRIGFGGTESVEKVQG